MQSPHLSRKIQCHLQSEVTAKKLRESLEPFEVTAAWVDCLLFLCISKQIFVGETAKVIIVFHYINGTDANYFVDIWLEVNCVILLGHCFY